MTCDHDLANEWARRSRKNASYITIVYILSCLIKKIKSFYWTEKKDIAEACKNPLLWNANYDRENNDYTNALRPRRFKWCDFLTNFMILFHMLENFYVSNFSPSIL